MDRPESINAPSVISPLIPDMQSKYAIIVIACLFAIVSMHRRGNEGIFQTILIYGILHIPIIILYQPQYQ